MITRLILENWRSHENTEFDFAKGTNVIVGAMGSGKSSAMDAISFALFGTFPNLQSRKIKLDDMIMNKPARKAYSKVSLAFKVNGKEYTVRREVTRGKGQTSAEIRMGDKLIEAANQRVNDRIEDILKVNYDLFSRAIYAEQNSIDYFLEIPKGKRREKIDELLKIDKFEAARKNLSIVTGRLLDMANDRNSLLSGYQGEGQMPELEKKLDDDSRELQKKENSLLEKKEGKEKAETVYNSLLKKKSAFSEHDNRIKEGMGRIKMYEEKLKEYGKIDVSENELKASITKKSEERKQAKSMNELRTKRESDLENRNRQLAGHEGNIAGYDRELAALGYERDAPAKLKECKRLRAEIEKALEETVTNYKSIGNRLSEVEDSIEKLKDGREKCPTCDSELDGAAVKRLVEKRVEERKKLVAGRAELQKEMEKSQAAKKKLDDELELLEKSMRNQEKAEVLNNERTKVAKLASAEKTDIDILKKSLEGIRLGRTEEEIEQEIKRLEEQLNYFMYRKELEKTRLDIEKMQKELSRLGYKEEEEKKAYDWFKELDKDVTVLMNECKSLSEFIADRKKRLDELKKVQREIEFLKKKVDSFEILQKALQDVQGKLREEFVEETNAALSDVWKRLYPYADYAMLRLAVDEAGDYILRLQRRDGSWTNVEGTASGGERSTACLALRISLSLVLTQNLSWLVLDEPTHNLDRRAIRELAVTLREHLPKIVDQVFVITHEEELESAASGYLYRLQRNKEEDEPTKIIAEQSIT